MKFFFAGYLLLLVGVFVLWSIEPLHRAQESSSSPAQGPVSIFAAASTSAKQALAAAPIASKDNKPDTGVPVEQQAENSSPATTSPSNGSLDPNAQAQTSEAASSSSSSATEPVAISKPAASSTPQAAARENPSIESIMVSEIELGIHQEINNERVKAGLPPLAFSSALSSLARAHSADMLKNNYFAHDDASGCSSSCRLTDSGYHWSTSGENIYVMSGYLIGVDKAVGMAVESWLGSAGHRANILNTSFTEEGIGIAFSGTKLYATEDFASPQ